MLIWLRPASGAQRRTRWTAVLTQTPDGKGVVSVDTTLPNRVVGVALRSDALEEFAGWTFERAEFPHGRSRIDFFLSRGADEKMAVEV